jgi:hypothetical protein
MECARCSKKITPADIPEYVNIPEPFTEKQMIEDAGESLYFLCKLCRDQVEPKSDPHYTKILDDMGTLIKGGTKVYVKFTCHNCGARQTIDEANKFFAHGNGCEECGKTSYPTRFGLMMMMSIGGKSNESL